MVGGISVKSYSFAADFAIAAKERWEGRFASLGTREWGCDGLDEVLLRLQPRLLGRRSFGTRILVEEVPPSSVAATIFPLRYIRHFPFPGKAIAKELRQSSVDPKRTLDACLEGMRFLEDLAFAKAVDFCRRLSSRFTAQAAMRTHRSAIEAK
ncbi:BHLH domain-containing protein [Psidium guajava]|nr:BHLH domain-containing protein [Psidium guajava]